MKLPAWYWFTMSVSTVLYAVAATTIVRRKLWSRLPVLLLYLLVVFVRDRIYVFGMYFWPVVKAATFYWIGEGVIYVVSFLLVMSVWKEALGRLRGLWAVARWILPGFLLVFLAFLGWSAQFPPGPLRLGDWGGIWLRLLSQNLSLTQALFLVGFLVVTSLFRVPVAPLMQRVAASWFAYSLAKVVLLAALYVLGVGFEETYGHAVGIAYLALLTSWAVLLWQAQPADLEVPEPVYVMAGDSRRLAGQLEAVNQSLSRLLKV